MKNDVLLGRLSTLPADAEIGVRIGDEHLNVTDLTSWGDSGFLELQCHDGDLRDMLTGWGLPADERERLVAANTSDGSQQ